MDRKEESGIKTAVAQDGIQVSLLSQWRGKANLLAILAVRAIKSNDIFCSKEIAPYLKRYRNQRAGFALLCFCSYHNCPPALIQFYGIVHECSFTSSTTSPDTSIQRLAASFPLHLPVRRNPYLLPFPNPPAFLPHLTFPHSLQPLSADNSTEKHHLNPARHLS